MSLYGMMRTGVSGMAAQANRLSTVADNIANSSTTGYKRSRAEFSSLVIPDTPGAYNSGGVTTTIQTAVSKQGVLQYTTSTTDLAVNGDGFFVVQDPSGRPFLTRAGAFVPDSEGRLVNAAGYQLMGYSYANGEPVPTANGFDGLEPVIVDGNDLVATPSRNGMIKANLPQTADAVPAADLPSTNTAGATYTAKTSLVTYDNLGGERLIDVYFTKTGPESWEVAVFDRAEATPGTGFPYASGPLATETLTFDPTTGKLDAGSPTEIGVPIPDGQTLTIDLSETSQLASDYLLHDAGVDGNAPTSIEKVEMSTDGTLYAEYADGSFRAIYRIPLADVPSPDNMQVLQGNVFAESAESGGVRLGFANEGGLGKVVSGALENSNVDIAEELTSMIESQRSYTANSKVFQTGSDLMDLLVNLKR
ncbi:flagellar hook protein FlgE [Aquibium sp. A9E412]|uniref:flagellar hook protein FlgE n=1 Tax=Aquibium sp. A9E412 TaxID=2976767 RepID=UPI0025B0D3C4|nr:flagellar hook protein FlgE [Aquibium sp. A9E412]MDN2567252.1 flagellar hook protein FlgE [Aquibium sp. A9E412]